MKRIGCRLASILVLISAFGLCLQTPSVGAEYELLLEMKVDESLIAVGESVNFTLTLKNIGTEKVTIFFSPPLFDLFYWTAEGGFRWSDGKFFILIVIELELEANETHTETLQWDLCQYKEEKYTPPEPGEYKLIGTCPPAGVVSQDPAKIIVTYCSDVNKDLKVDIQDLTIVAVAFGSKRGDPSWNPTADLDKSNAVNIIDVTVAAKDYGKFLSPPLLSE